MMKAAQQSRGRVVSYGLNRRARVAANEHCVQYSEKIQENLSDPETSGSRRENGSLAHLSAAETTNQQPLSHSYFEETNSKVWRIKPSDACTPSAQTFATNSQYLVQHPHVFGSPRPKSDVGLNSQVPSSASETIHKPGTTSGCPVFYDGSSLRKQQAAASFWSSDAGMHSNLSTIDNVRATLSKDFHSDEVETPQRHVGAESSFTKQMVLPTADFATHGHAYKLLKDNFAPLNDDITAAVSLASANLPQPRLRKEMILEPQMDHNISPLIPSHLQVSTPELSHLNFGCYKPHTVLSFSGSPSSKVLNGDSLGNLAVATDGSSVAHPDSRSLGYPGDKQIISMNGGHMFIAGARNYDEPASSQAEFMKHGSTASTPGNQCGYGFNYNKVNQCLSSAIHYSMKSNDTRIFTGHDLPGQPEVPVHVQSDQLEQLTDIISYPSGTGDRAYRPVAFQQTYPNSNGSFNQYKHGFQNAGVEYLLPHYKSPSSLTCLPLFASNASGYGHNGSHTNTARNFVQNTSTRSTSNGRLDLQYNGGNHFQQNENNSTWVCNPNHRTSAIPNCTFPNTIGQNQRHAVCCQGQQPLQHYEALKYSRYCQPELRIMPHQQ